jgi:hypothetical protein
MLKMIKNGLLILFLLASSSVQSQKLTADQWKEDFDSLRRFIEMKHVSPFWQCSEEDWYNLVRDIKAKFDNPSLSDEERVTLLTTMVAFTKDGHSSFLDLNILKALPLKLEFFGDDIYIVAATEEKKRLIGCKVLAWQNKPWATVEKLIRPCVPCSNQSGFRLFAPYSLINGTLLKGLHIIDQLETITLTLKDKNGNEFKSDIKFLTLSEYSNVKYLTLEKLLNLTPIQKRNEDENYWYTYLEDRKAIYFNYHHVRETPGRLLKGFADSLVLLSKRVPFDRLIIDLRENDGGNNFLNLYLLEKLCNDTTLNKRGKLFVLTGRKTFSAAICFASQLQMRSQAIFVGEPAGDAPSGPGDAETYSLPNSKARATLSHLFWNNTFSLDKRIELTPDLIYEESFDDYISGKDGTFDLALNYSNISDSPTHDNDLSEYLGFFEWEPDKDILIYRENNNYFIDAIGSLQSKLIYKADDSYNTKIKNIGFLFRDNKVTLKIGNEELPLKRIGSKSLLRNLYEGDNDVYEEYIKLSYLYPGSFALKGNNLTMQACYMFLRSHDRNTTQSLLNISLKLDPKYRFAGQIFDIINKW